jgi:hypothetical protein
LDKHECALLRSRILALLRISHQIKLLAFELAGRVQKEKQIPVRTRSEQSNFVPHDFQTAYFKRNFFVCVVPAGQLKRLLRTANPHAHAHAPVYVHLTESSPCT